ncbi:MAG: class I SAM-dependent methyltransferase [Candidatus Marinimicrobia bacterium]|nr:class I SAM-dependent methyltransferase [Candidatus Neomarinimicrobiota bacterium]
MDNFPPREELQRLITAAGFDELTLTKLTGGVVNLVRAVKPI